MLAVVFLLSAVVLAHEIALLRVLAIAHWHHAGPSSWPWRYLPSELRERSSRWRRV